MMNEYYVWLCELTGPRGKKYSKVLNNLWCKNFKWTVPHDDNRVFECYKLREDFAKDRGIEYIDVEYQKAANMLELIVSLSMRCESMTTNNVHDVTSDEWFWRILNNIDLVSFPDVEYEEMDGAIIIDKILDRVIDRTYHPSGKGGLFPLKRVRKDQRKVELWYQMCYYLVENYFMDDVTF